jgi:hypothetical protein
MFTVNRSVDEEEARRRAALDALSGSMRDAQGGTMSALDQMKKLGDETAARGLAADAVKAKAAQQDIENKRADYSLRLRDTDSKRRAEVDKARADAEAERAKASQLRLKPLTPATEEELFEPMSPEGVKDTIEVAFSKLNRQREEQDRLDRERELKEKVLERRARGPAPKEKDTVGEELKATNLRVAKARERALTGAHPEGTFELSDKLKNDHKQKVTTFVSTSERARNLSRLLSRPEFKDFTGRLDQLEAWAASKLGAQSELAAELSSALGQYFDTYKVVVTGAAASDKEMAMLQARLPGLGDSFEMARGKLTAGARYADEQAAFFEDVLQSNDVRGSKRAKASDLDAKKKRAEEIRRALAEEG